MRFDHLQKGLKAELDGNVWFSLCIKFKIKSRQQNSNSRRFNSISLPAKTMVISLSLPHYSFYLLALLSLFLLFASGEDIYVENSVRGRRIHYVSVIHLKGSLLLLQHPMRRSGL